jgi:hypothetical protein
MTVLGTIEWVSHRMTGNHADPTCYTGDHGNHGSGVQQGPRVGKAGWDPSCVGHVTRGSLPHFRSKSGVRFPAQPYDLAGLSSPSAGPYINGDAVSRLSIPLTRL